MAGAVGVAVPCCMLQCTIEGLGRESWTARVRQRVSDRQSPGVRRGRAEAHSSAFSVFAHAVAGVR